MATFICTISSKKIVWFMFFTFPDFSVAGLLAADLTGRQ